MGNILALRIKSPQLTNSASFEINLGIIAACIPLMKPLVRYVRARMSGEDPHMLLRTSTPTYSNSRWYSRGWGSRSGRSRPVGTSDAYDQSKSHEHQKWNPFHRIAKASHGNDTSTVESLGLPVQGIRKTTDIEMREPSFGRYDSQQNLKTDIGARWVVEDRV